MDHEDNSAGNRRIYVSNLDYKVAWQDLKDFFNNRIGDVTRADVVGKGWGTVEFGSVDSAVRAINELNDTDFMGREIHIREDRLSDKATGSRSGIGSYSASAGFTDDKNARVYVGNLPWDISEEELSQHMSQAGEVQACEILLNPSGKSKGCAIVQYKSSEEAEEAKNSLRDTILKNRPISVREDREEGISSTGAPVPSSSRPNFREFSRPFGQGSRPIRGGGGGGQWHRGNKRVFVSNLPWDCSWQDLKDYFREVGNVVHTDVLHTPDGKSKGCGIVDFETAEAAREAIHLKNDTNLKGRVIHVREDRDGPNPGHFGGPGPRWGGGGGFKNHYSGNQNKWGNQASNSSASREERQILVEGLDASVEWQDLKDFFPNAQYAEIFPSDDVNDNKTGVVKFRTPDEADNALNDKDGLLLNGKRISIRKDERVP